MFAAESRSRTATLLTTFRESFPEKENYNNKRCRQKLVSRTAEIHFQTNRQKLKDKAEQRSRPKLIWRNIEHDAIKDTTRSAHHNQQSIKQTTTQQPKSLLV